LRLASVPPGIFTYGTRLRVILPVVNVARLREEVGDMLALAEPGVALWIGIESGRA
jgi:hypothetical protein